MSGAGWGGAVVALTTKQEASKIVEGLLEKYYKVKFPQLDDVDLRKTVFVTQPGSGASVYIVSDKGIQ